MKQRKDKGKTRLTYTRGASALIIRPIRYRCELCGEDRIGMFEEVGGRVRCTVCGYPATVDEEVVGE